MNECFDYQPSPRFDMVFNIYIKEIIIFNFFYLLLFFERELKPTKKTKKLF